MLTMYSNCCYSPCVGETIVADLAWVLSLELKAYNRQYLESAQTKEVVKITPTPLQSF